MWYFLHYLRGECCRYNSLNVGVEKREERIADRADYHRALLGILTQLV